MTKRITKRLTKSALARELGMYRHALDKYLNMPGAPSPDKRKTYDQRAVAEWIASMTEAQPGSLEEWRLKELQLKCERLRRELDLAARQVISLEAHCRFVETMGRNARDHMYAVFTQELPAKIVGMSEVFEVRRALRDAGDAVCLRMQAGAAQFKNDYEAGREET